MGGEVDGWKQCKETRQKWATNHHLHNSQSNAKETLFDPLFFLNLLLTHLPVSLVRLVCFSHLSLSLLLFIPLLSLTITLPSLSPSLYPSPLFSLFSPSLSFLCTFTLSPLAPLCLPKLCSHLTLTRFPGLI